MNERIKTLIKESGGHNIAYEDRPGSYSYAFTDNSVEKFAELIVRECINICNDIADPHLYRNQDILQRMNPGASYAAKVIKLHFGVEE